MEEQWDVYLTAGVDQWLHDVEKSDPDSYVLVNQAIWVLVCNGPAEGRPLVEPDQGFDLAQSQGAAARLVRAERSAGPVMFDPWRSAILLVAGDKAGNWGAWYDEAIPLAERAYAEYLADREKESGK